MALRPVSAAEIESLAIGAWILGTGGGGSPYLALLNMRKLYREGVSVSLLDPMDLPDDARVAVGSIASTCKAPRTGKEVKECGILYSTSKAIRLGQTVQSARRLHRDAVQAVIEAEGGQLMFRGKIRDVARRTTEGFLRGTAKLDGLDDFRGAAFELAFQNEFAVGWLDGQPRVMTPDLICVLDSVSGDAIGTETLRYGQRVSVIALPAPPILLTPKGLEHVGPRAFGYDLEFRSVFS